MVSEDNIFDYNEMMILRNVLVDQVEYGVPIGVTMRYLKMIEKLEKWLEENKPNR